MSQLFRFPTSVERDPAIEVWMHEQDPKRLLEGTGKFMRHVKLSPERDVDTDSAAEEGGFVSRLAGLHFKIAVDERNR